MLYSTSDLSNHAGTITIDDSSIYHRPYLKGVTTYVYDNVGNQTSTTDAPGNKTTYTYDGNGNLAPRFS